MVVVWEVVRLGSSSLEIFKVDEVIDKCFTLASAWRMYSFTAAPMLCFSFYHGIIHDYSTRHLERYKAMHASLYLHSQN